MTAADTPFDSRRALVLRIVITLVVAAVAGMLSFHAHPRIDQEPKSDLSVTYAAARAWLSGENPYVAVGPGRKYEAPFGLVYPFPAVLVGVPFALTPYPDLFYSASGAALITWALTGTHRFRFAWVALLTPAFIYSVRMSQWATFMVGAALLPPWGFLLACKPTVGAALWLAFPNRQSVFGATALVAGALLLLPSWPWEWVAGMTTLQHVRAPLTFAGGPLLLLAFLRWRRPEARLLGALACIPHTTELYESLPLFLIPNRWSEAALLGLLNYGVVVARGPSAPDAEYVSDMLLTGQWMVWLMYLPCLLMILQRPNEWNQPNASPAAELPTGPGVQAQTDEMSQQRIPAASPRSDAS